MAHGALTLTDTTYAGEVAAQFIRNAIVGAETIKGGHVYVKDGIYKKFSIPRLELSNLVQDYSTTPTTGGTATVTASVLEPDMYMLYSEFDPQDFADHWYAPEMQEALIGRGLPVTVESAVTMGVLDFHNNYFDKAIWQGDISGGASPLDKFDGFITKAIADADVLDVTTSETALSASNIAAELEKVHALIPAALKFDPDFKIFVSYATAEFWSNAQIASTYKGIDSSQRGVMSYKGVKIVPLANFPDDVMLAAKGKPAMDSNLWVGINSTSDNEVTIGRVANNSDARFVKVLFKADTNFGFGKEVVLYQVAEASGS